MATTILDWLHANYPLIVVSLLVLAFMIYNYFKKKKIEQQQQNIQEEAPEPQYIPIDLDSPVFEKEFNGLHRMEESNLEMLRRQRDTIINEIREKSDMIKKARHHWQDIVETDKRLRTHIPILHQQLQWYEHQIKELENRMR